LALLPALAFAIVFALHTPAHAAGEIRVGLGEGLGTVELSGAPMLVQDLDGRALAEDPVTSLRVLRRDGAVDWRGQRVAGIRVVPAGALPLRFQQRPYPGLIDVVGAPDGLIVVNQLPLEEYLVGAVKAEAGDKMPIEMLKAQAIVARTYAAYHRRLNAAKPYHLVAGTANQQYAGRVTAESPAWAAVMDTEGQVLLWEGDLFPAFYHTDSGGYTEDPRVVFAAVNMPALHPVRVEFPSHSPHHAWSLEVGLADLAAALKRGGVSVGSITGLRVLERSTSLRVARISVLGTRGSATLRGNEFRRLVGYDTLKSTLFAVSVDRVHARFAGRGYGHGVGLDQWSAKTMAEQGYTASQIVQYYYPGASLSSLNSTSFLK
jgi:stage II sporulation protein D